MALTSSLLEVLAWHPNSGRRLPPSTSAMQEDADQTTPASPELLQAGWREVLTRKHLPRLLVLCLAVWLHAANTMLAATTLPEAVGDIGGLRLISWAFALYLMGSIVAATATRRARRRPRPASHHAGGDPGLHPGVRHLRLRAGDAGAARRSHRAGSRRRRARRAGVRCSGPFLSELAGAANHRLPVSGVDGLGPVRTAHRRRVRHRRAVAGRLLVLRGPGPGARVSGVSAACPNRARRGDAGAANPGLAPRARRRGDSRDLVRGRGGFDRRCRRAPGGGMPVPVALRRPRFRLRPSHPTPSEPRDRLGPSGRLRHRHDVHALPVHDGVRRVRPHPPHPAVPLDSARGRLGRRDRIARLDRRRVLPFRTHPVAGESG